MGNHMDVLQLTFQKTTEVQRENPDDGMKDEVTYEAGDTILATNFRISFSNIIVETVEGLTIEFPASIAEITIEPQPDNYA